MNNPSPLVPQGSILEQQAKSKSHLRIVFFIVAVHVVFFVGILMQGCKREDQSARLSPLAPTNTDLALPPLDTNVYANLPPLDGGTNQPPASTPPAMPGVGLAPVATNLGLASGQSPLGAPPPFTPPSDGLAPAPMGTVEYEIKRNDSFYTIAKKFGVSMNAIAQANPGVVSSKLKVGQKIQVPAPSIGAGGGGMVPAPMPGAAIGDAGASVAYSVKPNDTLTKIARAHGTTVKAIKSANNLKTDMIKVGQKLQLPAPKTPAMTTEPPPTGGGLVPMPGLATPITTNALR